MDDLIPELGRVLRYGADHTHAEFTNKIAEDLFDRTAPMVYADWLDEQGHSGVAGIVRRSVTRHAEDDPNSETHAVTQFNPSEWTGYHVPETHPEGVPSVYYSGAWEDEGHGPMAGVGTLHRVSTLRPPGANMNRQADRYGSNLYFGEAVPVEEAYRLLYAMPEVRNADRALADLRRTHPHLDPQRKGK